MDQEILKSLIVNNNSDSDTESDLSTESSTDSCNETIGNVILQSLEKIKLY